MAAILQVVWYANAARRALRRERVFRDRINPLDIYDDHDFKLRYRFSRVSAMYIIDEITPDLLTRYNNRLHTIPPSLQVLLALRFYANGSFQRVTGDLHGLS